MCIDVPPEHLSDYSVFELPQAVLPAVELLFIQPSIQWKKIMTISKPNDVPVEVHICFLEEFLKVENEPIFFMYQKFNMTCKPTQ